MTGATLPIPAGRQCELFGEDVFSELRAFAQVPDDFVNSGWGLEKLQHGGGKGGSQMARVGNAYIVKELSKGDHESLQRVTASYGQHVRSGATLLCPIYLHFQDKDTGRYFFAMRNSIGTGPFAALYDLKGCADDKLIEEDGKHIPAIHKRVWNVGMWFGKSGWTPERRRYYAGKVKARSSEIPLLSDQRTSCLRAMERDTAWLRKHRLMDYSFLVAIKVGAAGNSATGGFGPSTLGQRPMIYRNSDGEEVAVFVAIIDFLQTWTTGKRIARCIKFAECNKATVPPADYAQRFNRHFARHLVEVSGVEAGSIPLPEKKALGGAVPPAGDDGQEGQPEDRIMSRPIPDEGGRAPVPVLSLPTMPDEIGRDRQPLSL